MSNTTTDKQASEGKILEGIVTKSSVNSTAAIEVIRTFKHPKYKKYLTRKTKLLIHDPENQCQVGKRVAVLSVKPISKLKRWAFLRLLAS